MRASGRFSPGVIDYERMSARYQSGRALSGEAAKTWSAVVDRFVQCSTRSRILDLGVGLRDPQACADELRRVVRHGGHVLVRGTFGDRLDGFPTLFRFWPAARAICEQLPTIQDTVRVFEASGFRLIQSQRIQQETAASLGDFAKRTRSRADSALMLISDFEFEQGQIAIETAAARETPGPVVEVIELLVFRHGSD